MKRETLPIGIRIQVSVMIPSVKKPGKGVVIDRAEATTVMVDPTDAETMECVIRGCLVNAQLTMPEAIMCGEANEIYEVDLECVKAESPKAKPSKRRVGKKGERKAIGRTYRIGRNPIPGGEP